LKENANLSLDSKTFTIITFLRTNCYLKRYRLSDLIDGYSMFENNGEKMIMMSDKKKEKLKGRIQEKLNNWKNSAEHLNVQLHLGAEETKDEFEKQKRNLNDWIDIQSKKLHNVKDISHEKALQIKTAMEELQVQAALGKAETEDALKEQQMKLSNDIHNLKLLINKNFSRVKGNTTELLEEINETLDDYHTRFDLFRLQTHLSKMGANESWNEKKKELSAKLNDLGARIERKKEKASERMDDFSDEMSEAWSHIRKAFKSK